MKQLIIYLLIFVSFSSCNDGAEQTVDSNNTFTKQKVDYSGSEVFYTKAFAEGDLSSHFYASILQRVEEGRLKAYTSENFDEEWDYAEWMAYSNRVDSFYSPDPETNEPKWEIRKNSFSWEDIAAYKFKVSLMGDNSLKTHAIAPMYSLMSDGSPIGEVELFWIKNEDLQD